MKNSLNSTIERFPSSSLRHDYSNKMLEYWHFAQKMLVTISFFLFLLSVSSCREKTEIPESLTVSGKHKLEDAEVMSSPVHTSIKLFDGGTGGYHAYRIPSIVRTTNGTLIAFCEGRVNTDNDFGNINVVCRRSSNNGASWLPLQVVEGSTLGTWGHPTPVVDWDTGRIWLFMTWNDASLSENGTGDTDPIDTWGQRRVRVTWSDNNGATWATPVDKTSTLLPPTMSYDAIGPGIGIQTTGGPNPGRLIIPARRRNIYSDDHGATWQYEIIPGGTDENTIVELANGTLMHNSRPGGTLWGIAKRRHISTGTIEGGFSEFTPDWSLPDPRCQGSILRYAGGRSRIIFLNSQSTTTRYNMFAQVSYDEGQSWYAGRRLHNTMSQEAAAAQGKGGYSSMTKTADFAIGALVEQKETPTGTYNSHWSIEFQKFNLPWLLNGQPEP